MAQTQVQREYAKNRRRIQRAVKRLESRGYLVPENIIPAKPKKVTPASVRRLEKISLDIIYKKSRYVYVRTGEILKGQQGRALEKEARRQRQSKIAKNRAIQKRRTVDTDYVDFSNQVFFMFQTEMNEIFSRNPAMLRVIEEWFNLSLARYGREEFASALEKAKYNNMFPSYTVLYDKEALNESLTRILEFVGGTEGGRAEIIEALEQMEDWEDYD